MRERPVGAQPAGHQLLHLPRGVHSSGSVHYKPLAKRVALAALAITLSAKKPDSRALCAKMQGKIGKRRD